jgi:small subunit ribosomal protein S9
VESLPLVSATGRRKRAVAQVLLIPKTGGNEEKPIVNGRDINKYMQLNVTTVSNIESPLSVLKLENRYNAFVKVTGGGIIGQAQAIRLGIARALSKIKTDPNYSINIDSSVNEEGPINDPNYIKLLKNEGFLTQDSRCKERKKYSLKKARRAPQFSKR